MTANAELVVRVARRRAEAQGICSFELVAQGSDALPAFSAGSHIDVHLPNGLVRQYSLCSDPDENHRYMIGVLNDDASRGGSRCMHEKVHEGSTLRISAPRNHFMLASGSHRSLLLAGGIGITPILCMAERLACAGADFELHYSARSRDRAAFIDRLEQPRLAGRVHLHFDDDATREKLNLAQLLSGGGGGDTHLYVCGPKGYMDAVLETARGAGWDPSRLHHEFFAGGQPLVAGDQAFEVRLASSGRIIPIGSGQTVAQALAVNGVEIATSCEQGVCGTCLTRVLEGVPDHRDLYLTPEEQQANDQFTPCCSRSHGPMLVLDL